MINSQEMIKGITAHLHSLLEEMSEEQISAVYSAPALYIKGFHGSLVDISALKAEKLRFTVAVNYNRDLAKPFEELLIGGCESNFFSKLPESLPISEKIGSGMVSKDIYLIKVNKKFTSNKEFFNHIESLGYCFDWLATATLAEQFPYVRYSLGFHSLAAFHLGESDEKIYGLSYKDYQFFDGNRVNSYEFPMRGESHGWIAVVENTDRKSCIKRKFYTQKGNS